jgi:hypothetical protein
MQPTNHSTKTLRLESCQIVIRRPLLEQTNLHTKHTWDQKWNLKYSNWGYAYKFVFLAQSLEMFRLGAIATGKKYEPVRQYVVFEKNCGWRDVWVLNAEGWYGFGRWSLPRAGGGSTYITFVTVMKLYLFKFNL